MTENVVMSQAERIKRYGIECIGPDGEGILFKAGHWRPGGEYIQKLIIRNVSTKTKKFKYKLPSTRYFSLEYPEPIILSPGMFKEIDVIFRPVEYEPYDDTLYIKMLDGIDGNGFHVPVQATIDKLILTAPEGLDLGYCATHQVSTITFHLVNEGEIDAPYKWDVPAPFVFTPSSGTIAPKQYHDIVLTIRPEDASVFVAQAICHVGTGVHAIIPNPIITTKLSAIGKYAYIALSEKLVSFDEVVSGTKSEKKEVLLQNNSVVPAEFSLVRFDGDRDEVFEVHPKSGIILPRCEVTVTVSYSALAMGCYSLDRYVFRTPGNCSTMLVCRGMTMPPRVLLYKEPVLTHGHPNHDESTVATTTLSNGLQFSEGSPEFSLNFRDVEVGRVETRILFLQNDSARDVAYSVIADEHGVFQMHPKQGVIPSKSSSFAIKVIFSPPKPSNYYRRFFVLVGDSLPLFYDCLGTGYVRSKGEVKEQRPAPLRHAHVQAFRNRSVQGLGVLSPDELDDMFAGRTALTNNAAGDAASFEDMTFADPAPAEYFALTGRTGTRAMSVTALQRPVTRTGESLRTKVAPAHEFFISDTDTTCREITLDKTTLDFGYASHHRPSDPKRVTVHNHTHAKVVVQWQIPVVSGMEITHKQDSRDERVIITGDSAERELALLQAFIVTPVVEEINPGKLVTFDVVFAPKQSNRNFVCELEAFVYFKNQRTFRLVNDYSLTPPWCLKVAGVGHTFSSGQLLAKARVTGGNIRDGKLVFPCCFEGESTYQTFMLRNTSNLPSTFKIELGWAEAGDQAIVSSAQKETAVFSVKPEVGEVDAESFVLICVRFSPTTSRKYIQLLRCVINGETGGKLMLEGAGAIPYVILPDLLGDQFPREELCWGLTQPKPAPAMGASAIPRGFQGNFFLKPTCIGLSTTRTLTIKNASRLPLRFKVKLSGSADGVLSVSPGGGVLKGNEDTQVVVSFAPRKIGTQEFKLQISVYPIGGRTQRVLDANQPGPVVAPEMLQNMWLNVVAPSEVGALVFDPARMTVDVRLVNTTETKDIYIDNVSDADLRYNLLYKEEFIPDTVDTAPVRTESEVMPLVAFGSLSGDSDGDKTNYDHCLFCESPRGIIAARSRLRLVFTYQPRKSGLFEFLIFAQVMAVDRSSNVPTMLSNDEAALLRVSQGDRLNAKNVKFDMNSTTSTALLPLTSNITARAAFPKLLFEDIRADSPDVQIADLESLWRRFSFSALNYDLSVPLTPAEVALNESSAPNMELVRKYPFEFCPAVVGAPLQKMVIQLRNNGYLPTSFHLHLPNESTLELEQWCDEDEPSEELNRLVCIIEELRLFTIEPRHGLLQPGEVCTLSVSYNHVSLKYGGLHNLPVLVKLAQGKQFVLNLIGHTLPSPAAPTGATGNARKSAGVMSTNQSVATAVTPQSVRTNTAAAAAAAAISSLSDILLVIGTGADKVIRLAPVPTGLSATLAPRQRFELFNVSGTAINYEVDQAPLNALNDEQYHLQLVRIANPTGFVPAGGSVFLEIYFYPLEARSYEFPLTVKYCSAAPALWLPPNSSRDISPPKSSATGAGRKSSSSSIKLKGERSLHSAMQQHPGMPNNSPVTYQYLSCVVQATGYDPRDRRPIKLESLYEGGLPPITPLLQLPSQCVTLSRDLVEYDVVPQHCTARRLLVLRNHSDTAVFEFVVDESSCVLCIDGLLSVSPTFGKIEPNGSAVLDLVFLADTQPILFEECLRVMIREVIKGVANRRGGVKHLLDRIKSKKTVSVEHESVVSRPTFSRTIQMETHEILANGDRRAVYPSTVNASGNVVSFSKSVSAVDALMERERQMQANGGGDFSVAGGMSELGGGGPHGSAFNPIMEMDVSRSAAGGKVRSVSQSSGGGFGSPNSGRERSATGSRMGAISESGRSRMGSGSETMSRGGGLTPFSRDSHRSDRTESSPSTLLGTANVLIVRVRGEVHGIETVRSIVERVDTQQEQQDASRLHVMEEYVIPTDVPFVPPVGKRRGDPEILAANQKARVNISFVKGRDAELRAMSSSVLDVLIKDLLGASDSADITRNTLSGGLNKPTYGMYFAEVRGTCPSRRLLEERLVIEAHYLGYITPTSAQSDLTKNLPIPSDWRTASEDAELLLGFESLSLRLSDLRALISDYLHITNQNCPSTFTAINNSVSTMAHTVDGHQINLEEANMDESELFVKIVPFVCSLPLAAATEMYNQLVSLGERRVIRTKQQTQVLEPVEANITDSETTVITESEMQNVDAQAESPIADNPNNTEHDATVPDSINVSPLKLSQQVVLELPARDALSQTKLAMAQAGFLDAACDVMGTTMLSLLREVLAESDVADEAGDVVDQNQQQ